MLSAWTTYHDENAEAQREQLEALLTLAGIQLGPYDSQGTTPGLVFTSCLDDALCQRLQSVSKGGRRRVVTAIIEPVQPQTDSDCSTNQAWQLLKAGGGDLVDFSHAEAALGQIVGRLQRWHTVDRILESTLVKKYLIGESQAWRANLRQVIDIARFSTSPTLILGESGTGKELISRLVHTLDPRPKRGELITVDCTNLAPDLAGSELFGHERGAFTGAATARDGAFKLADGGTLFLDEVGELPAPLQAQLLRVLQEHTYKPVGGNHWSKTNFRLVCATNRDLKGEVQAGRFRGDLYFRLATWVLHLPPLRQRKEDILPLARHFMREKTGEDPALDPAVEQFLLQREYPGNVRELEHVVARIGSQHIGHGPVTIGCIPSSERPQALATATSWHEEFDRCIQDALNEGVGLKELCSHTKETVIRMVVAQKGGNLQRAAKALGITDRSLQMWRTKQGQPVGPPMEHAATHGALPS